MRYLLILPFIISCSLLKKESSSLDRQVAGSGLPARIVKIINPTDSSIEVAEAKSVPIGIKAFKYGTAVAAGRKVFLEVVAGSGSLEKSELTTNSLGEASTRYLMGENPESINIKLKIDNVIKRIKFITTRPEKYIGDYSLLKSEVSLSQQEVFANGKEEVEVSLQIKNSQGDSVDAYGLSVYAIVGESKLDFYDQGGGNYQGLHKVGEKSGEKEFDFFVEGKTISKKVKLILKPVINISRTKPYVKKMEDGGHRFVFSLYDLAGQKLVSTKYIDLKTILTGKGNISKVEFEDGWKQFYYTYTIPYNETGKTKLGISIDGKELWTTNEITYEFVDFSFENSKITIEDRKIHPTGIDGLEVVITAKDSQGQKLQSFGTLGLPRIEVSDETVVTKMKKQEDGSYLLRIIPTNLTTELTVTGYLGNKVFDEQKLSFDYKPLRVNIEQKWNVNSPGWYKEIYHTRVNVDSRYTPGIGNGEGFKLTNEGDNAIVMKGCAPDNDEPNRCQATRDFDFDFKDQANQNMQLQITDIPTDFTSHMMLSNFYFFPRKVLPHFRYSEDKSTIIVTIPTGEEVIFDAITKEIIGGVFEEGPIDFNSSRHARKFANIRYKGFGVVLRVNARGQSPELGQFNRRTISGDYGNNGGAKVLIYKYNAESDSITTCNRDKKHMWPQIDQNPIPFNFATDASFDAYIQKYCGFGFLE